MFAVIFALSHPVHAEDCAALQADETAIDCAEPGLDAAPDLSFNVPESKPAIASAPLPAEISAETSGSAAPLPFTLNGNDASISAKASLSSLKDYHSKLTAKKIEEAKAANGTLVAPGVVATSPSRVDVWSALNAQQDDAARTTKFSTSTGIDYNLLQSTKVGVAAERVESSGSVQSGSEDKVSAYAAFTALPEVTLDTKAQWSAASQSGSAADASKKSITVAPRIGHTFEIDHGQTVQPYVTLSREFDFAGGAAAAGGSATAGAGVTLAKPESYSLSVTTDVTNGGATDPTVVKSGFELKLPIK